MQVSLEEAYAEACRVIGEQAVTLRLLSQTKPEGADQSEAGDS